MTSMPDHDEGAAVAARIERRWTIMSAALVGLLVGVAIFAGIHKATMPQAWVETANPQTLHISGEFIESNLGSAVEADGSVTVRAVGQQDQHGRLPMRQGLRRQGRGHRARLRDHSRSSRFSVLVWPALHNAASAKRRGQSKRPAVQMDHGALSNPLRF